MTELLLHIGSHKTGTTAVQRACRRAIQDRGRDAVRYFNVRPSGTRVTKAAGRGPNFRVEVDLDAADAVFRPERGIERFVTSDEEFFWIHEPETVERFARMLRDRFGSIRILCYLRRQDRLAFSHRKQVIEQSLATRFYGVTTTPLPVYRPYFQRYFDYAAKLSEIWCTAFGKDNVELVPYDRAALKDGDVVADFAHRAGVSFSALPAREINASFAGNQTFVGLKMTEHGVSPDLRKEVMKSLRPGGVFAPTRDEAMDFVARFADANACLARDWTWNGRPFVFDDDFSAYPDAREPFSIAETAEMLDALMPCLAEPMRKRTGLA